MNPERQVLSIIADNPMLMDALRATLREQMDLDSIDFPIGTSDDIIGQLYRSRRAGLQLVEDGLREVAQYKTTKIPGQIKNPAR